MLFRRISTVVRPSFRAFGRHVPTLSRLPSSQFRALSLQTRQEGKSDNPMFCFQCEQTDENVGCETLGVCGKTPQVAGLQDLLVHYIKGISMYARRAREHGHTDKRIDHFVMDSLFATLTNVNFDPDRFVEYLKKAAKLRDLAKDMYELAVPEGSREQLGGPANFKFVNDLGELEKQALHVGVVERSKAEDENVFSLQEMTVYGMKGLSAYACHARHLGKEDDEVSKAVEEIMDTLCEENQDLGTALANCLKVGEVNLKVMEMLDRGHTLSFGHPTPYKVRRRPVPGKCLLVSGHDIHDLETILESSEGKGVNVYTHGEMLPAHGYPALRDFEHFVGHFGGPWQLQNFEFRNFPGSIVMTTNCLKPPKTSYRDRLFTTMVTGFEGVKHLPDKDHSAAIQKALECDGFTEEDCEDYDDNHFEVGYGHNTILSLAGEIIAAIEAGDIKRFYVIGGCDGSESERSYFRETAMATSKDSLILTMGCGKYRFNDLDLGNINGIPRVLDMGQCNDAYSGIKVAAALAEAMKVDLHDLPISFVVSWFEQKAVAVLLSLLHLNLKDIRLGPRLPAFVTPAILDHLVSNYGLKPIGDVSEDLKNMELGN